MIKERYVSLEVARLLKEKGFNEYCRTYYKDNMVWEDCTQPIHWNNVEWEGYKILSAPTQQMACDWLQEKHNLFFGVGFGNDVKGEFLYMADIYDTTDSSVYGIYKPIVEADDYLKNNPKTVGDAIDAALKYALEYLI